MFYITQEAARLFYERLLCEGKDIQTVCKYQRDLYKLREFLNGKELTQESLEEYKAWLVDVKKYKIKCKFVSFLCKSFLQVNGKGEYTCISI